MNIKVIIEETNIIRDILPKYDKEANILEVQYSNSKNLDWKYGIDIDGILIIDIDNNYNLVNFDLLVNRKYWKNGNNNYDFKTLKKLIGNLKFTQESIIHKSFNLPLVIELINKNELVIKFNNNEIDTYCILSKNCSALVANEYLAGFHLFLI